MYSETTKHLIKFIMKKFFSIAAATLLVCSMSFAQSEVRQTIRERKLLNKQARAEMTEKASKDAIKMAKTYKKQGWIVAPGQLPLERQLDKSYQMQYEFEDDQLPKYVLGDAKAVGESYDAAKMLAVNNAKMDIAAAIEMEVTSLTESTLANKEISSNDASSINEAIRAGKNLVANKLGRTFTVVQCYRNLPGHKIEVNVTLAYSAKLALAAAKDVVREQLEAKGKDLHEQLDKMWGTFNK